MIGVPFSEFVSGRVDASRGAAWGCHAYQEACAVIVGLLFTNTPPLLEGPLNQFVGGVDISLLVASGLGAILYYGALKLRRGDVLPDFR